MVLQIPIVVARIIGMITFLGEDLYGKLVPHSFHPTLYVLFIITFTKPLPERLGLIRKFKRGEKIRV